MKKIINLLTITAILLSGYILFASSTRADVMNPDFLTKKCNAGEKEVVCSYSSKEPFGSRTIDECKKYANNSNYYYLVGHGSSFGGEEKYCLKVSAQDNAANQNNGIEKNLFLKDNYVITGGIVIVVTIISFLVLFLIRKRNVNK